MNYLLYAAMIIMGIFGILVLNAPDKKFSRENLGVTLGGLTYIAGAMFAYALMSWWPLFIAFIAAHIVRRFLGDRVS